MSANIKTCLKCGAKNFVDFKACFNCGNTTFSSEQQKKADMSAQSQQETLQNDKELHKSNESNITVGFGTSTSFKPQNDNVDNDKPVNKAMPSMKEAINKTVELGQNLEASFKSSASTDSDKFTSEISDLKNDNKHMLDILLKTQKEQIEKLESELARSNEKIVQMHETSGREKESINYLLEEKRNLENQILAERERFDMLLQDVERTKSLALVSVDVPNDYIIYSGDPGNADYLNYAKRQFMKVYPKITSLDGNEDVVFYIPGEINNPPVLILNPNINKDYARNIKLNLVSVSSDGNVQIGSTERKSIESVASSTNVLTESVEPQKTVGENTVGQTVLQTSTTTADTLSSEQTPVENVQIDAVHQKTENNVSDDTSIQTVSNIMKQLQDENAEKNANSETTATTSQKADEVKQSEINASDGEDMNKMIGYTIDSSTVKTNAIADISELENIISTKKASKKYIVTNVFVGIFALIGIAFIFLPFILMSAGDNSTNISGLDIAMHWMVQFEASLANDYTALVIVSPMLGGEYALWADYMPYLVFASFILTFLTAFVFIIGCCKAAFVNFIKYFFFVLSIIADIAIIAFVYLVFNNQSISITPAYGIWIKAAFDLVLMIVAIIFMRSKKTERGITPLTINV